MAEGGAEDAAGKGTWPAGFCTRLRVSCQQKTLECAYPARPALDEHIEIRKYEDCAG